MHPIEYVTLTDAPPPYSNHVLIEQTRGGTYRFEGVSNRAGRPGSTTASMHFRDLDATKRAAEEWARENDVHVIYLKTG